jgi:uncharacterized protein (TIGR03435 family)
MRIIALGLLGFSMAGGVFSEPPAAPATFEVASVKPSPPDAPGMFTRYLPDGGVRFAGATLKNLVSIAYGVRQFQISGGPRWIDTDRFDIEARAETSGAVTPLQRKTGERLRSLLADRFQLALHRETKEHTVYELVVARGGPKLQESKEGKNMVRAGRGTVKGQSVGLAMLAMNLANELGCPVIDKTGLSGKYDFDLTWTPIPPSAASPSEAPDGPSIFTALTEQLGLRLESKKGPVEVLVIDSAERPSKN